MSLIPESAKRDLAESDAHKAKARKTASEDGFRRSFTNTFAREIEMIRVGAIATKVDAEGRVLEAVMPDGKPLPTIAASRRHLQWSRFTRFVRTVLAAFPRAFHGLVREIRDAWKGW